MIQELVRELAALNGVDTSSLESPSWSEGELLALRVGAINGTPGNLTGYDCAACLNRGYTAEVAGDSIITRECACMAKRRNLRRMEKSGLAGLLDEYTFETYTTPEAWQADAKRKALDYVRDYRGRWFVACGSVGAGKTHLCTAICGALLEAGKDVRYMLWRDEVTRLKAVVTDEAAYDELMTPLKTVEVLYIDDFWKTERGKAPTTADVNVAFELLNARYNRKDLATIISSERTIHEMLEIDEAVGSRIYQRSKETCVVISGAKNWRLRA